MRIALPIAVSAVALCGPVLGVAVFLAGSTADAAPVLHHQAAHCPAFVPHGRANGHISLVKWSLNRHSGVTATIYATLKCAPKTAFSKRWETYLDGANLLKPVPKNLMMYTTNAKTPPF